MRIISLCGDPGGARAISPVIKLLEKEGDVVAGYAYRQAVQLLEEEQCYSQTISEESKDEDLQSLVRNFKPNIVLLGTSVNGIDLETKMIRVCRELSVPTFSVLDFWSNYVERFTIGDIGSLDALPDLIAVMDSTAFEEMKGEGFPEEHLCVTGQPAFDEIFQPFDTGEARRRVRSSFNIDDDALLILFASQPLDELKKLGACDYGYTELVVLDLLYAAFVKWKAEARLDAKLWIRPHPRENIEKFSKWSGDNVFVSLKYNRMEALASTDLVVGMNSIFLLEACFSGVSVVSLQPGLKGDDVLPLYRIGLGSTCYQKDVDEVMNLAFSRLGKGHDTKGKLLKEYAGGTLNVVSQLRQLAAKGVS